jgi:hypothetical protein
MSRVNRRSQTYAEAADIDLPPVAASRGYDFSRVTPRTSEPLVPTSAPEPGAGYDFSSVTPRQPAPVDTEAKPLNLSFGGQEGAIARAAMGPPKPVTTPEAADGTDVTFEKDGRRFNLPVPWWWTRLRGRSRGWMGWCRRRRGDRWRRRPRRARRSRC